MDGGPPVYQNHGCFEEKEETSFSEALKVGTVVPEGGISIHTEKEGVMPLSGCLPYNDQGKVTLTGASRTEFCFVLLDLGPC